MRRSTLWRPIFYVAIFAAALVLTAETFDKTELHALAATAAAVLACELVGQYLGRKRRRASHPIDVSELASVRAQLAAMQSELGELRAHRTVLGGGCGGPYSVTVFVCNGERVEVETCSPAGTSLDDHLAEHTRRVLAEAARRGCS
jgi:hypothetical protein